MKQNCDQCGLMTSTELLHTEESPCPCLVCEDCAMENIDAGSCGACGYDFYQGDRDIDDDEEEDEEDSF